MSDPLVDRLEIPKTSGTLHFANAMVVHDVAIEVYWDAEALLASEWTVILAEH